MTKQIKKRTAGRSAVSVRLTPEERAVLDRDAGTETLSDHIRARLFGDTQRVSTDARQKMLAQILAQLGKAEIAQAMAELTELARLGLLSDDADTLRALTQAQAEFSALRCDLLRALGLRPKSGGAR